MLFQIIQINTNNTYQMLASKIKDSVAFLQKNGYALIPNFITPQKCEQAINQIDRLVDAFEPNSQNTTIFDGSSGQSKHRLSKYFLDSAGKISFFFEPKAWKDGKLITPKRQSINKIGHSIHQHNQLFQGITYTNGVDEICHELGIKNPLVMQSMAILKPPKIGGKVNTHQDSTYLYGQPDTLMGFWIPLQDATIKNGCLWGLPSNNNKLYTRSKVVSGIPSDQRYHEVDYNEKDFVPLEMKRGSLAIFTGRFLHFSLDNTSDTSRYAYTWHLMDQSSKWSPENWLQRQHFPKYSLKNQAK